MPAARAGTDGRPRTAGPATASRVHSSTRRRASRYPCDVPAGRGWLVSAPRRVAGRFRGRTGACRSTVSRFRRLERCAPRRGCARCAATRDRSPSRLEAGRGLWIPGPTRHRQDDARDAHLQGTRCRPTARSRSTRCRACWRCCARPSATSATHSLSQLIDMLCSVDLLHIDDVGAEQTSPWVLEQLYTVVNTRYEEQRSIIVTTNLIDTAGTTDEPDRELRDQIGDRHRLAPVRDVRRSAADVRRGPPTGDPVQPS